MLPGLADNTQYHPLEDHPIPVLVVEDQAIVQDRLTALFRNETTFQPVVIASSGEEAREHLRNSKPELMIVDLELPGIKGDELIETVHREHPEIKIAVFTVFEDQNRIFHLLKLGIKGYILKETSDDLLLAELQVIALGGATLTSRIAKMILEDYELKPAKNETALTDRENEVLNLVGLGMKYKDIARQLNISHHTVRRHIEKIYNKLEVKNKIEALSKAGKMGLIE